MSATRFYFPSTGSVPATVALAATWNVYTSTATKRPLIKTTKSNTSVGWVGTGVNYYPSANETGYLYCNQYVSEQQGAYSWTTSDTIEFQSLMSETNALNNLYLALNVRVVSADGGTVRGTLFAGYGPVECAVSAVGNRSINGASAAAVQNAVSQQNGDRIVVEVGVYYLLTSDAAGIAPSWYGGDATATSDLTALDDAGTSYGCMWIEFSPTIADYSAAATNVMLNII